MPTGVRRYAQRGRIRGKAAATLIISLEERMNSKTLRWLLPLLVLPLFAVACDDDGVTSDTAQVSLMLTDALGDHVDNVWIEIDSIYLQGTGGRTVLFDADVDAPDLGLVELTELGGDPDLGEPGVAVELISDVEVAPGSYGQLRFVIGSAVLESGGEFWAFNGAEVPEEHPSRAAFEADTDVGTLNCPSCTQTGIKALLPQDEANIEAGSHIIVLDFDVGRSFGREAGMSGQWVMSPIIVATELEFSGGVTGTVAFQTDSEGAITATLPAECPTGTAITAEQILGFFEVTATGTDDVLHTAAVDASDGSYAFAVLSADTYAMSFTTPRVINDADDALSFDDVSISVSSVELASGTVETVDYTINTVSCTNVGG